MIEKKTPKLQYHTFETGVSMRDAQHVANIMRNTHNLHMWPSWNADTKMYDVITEASLTPYEITSMRHFINGAAAGIMYRR